MFVHFVTFVVNRCVHFLKFFSVVYIVSTKKVTVELWIPIVQTGILFFSLLHNECGYLHKWRVLGNSRCHQAWSVIETEGFRSLLLCPLYVWRLSSPCLQILNGRSRPLLLRLLYHKDTWVREKGPESNWHIPLPTLSCGDSVCERKECWQN